jgi:two-component system, cell cycle sensor histidine kinase and response regulator CckA
MCLNSVKVPPEFAPLFAEAEKTVAGFFRSMSLDPSQGTITIGGERYVLVRATSLSVEFFNFMKRMYPGLSEREAQEGTGAVLFDMAFSLGRSDAQAFCEKLNVDNPMAKLSSGPVHFSHSGWAFVDIHAESRPAPNESYYLVYDHPRSFEADSWLALGEKTDFCTCFMNAGYSSGWCSESFGLKLVAKEISCRARGDEHCRFIMAPPVRLEGHVRNYASRSKAD